MTDESDETEKSKPSKGALYLIPLLIVAAIAFSFILPLISNSPENSIKKVGKAFSDQDLSTFRELVDVESVLSRAFEDALDSIDELLTAPEDGTSDVSGDAEMEGFGDFGALLGIGIIQAIIPELVAPIEDIIEKAVEQGELRVSDLTPIASGFLGDIPEKELPDEDVDLIELVEERLEVVKIAETSRSGKTAQVDLVLRDKESDKQFTLELLVRDTGSGWQIAEITDVSDLLDELPTDKLPAGLYDSLLGDPFDMDGEMEMFEDMMMPDHDGVTTE